MNYTKIYNNLIETRLNRITEEYTEKHHIIPRSMGGSNDKNNIVNLTAREHFIAHWLLWRIHRNISMRHAFWMMGRRRKLPSRYYDILKKTLHSKTEGKPHHFTGGTIQRESNLRQIALGIHPFQNKEIASKNAKKRILEGNHHFLESDFNKRPFILYKNNVEVGKYSSKVEAVEKGWPAHIIDKLRAKGQWQPTIVKRKYRHLFNNTDNLTYKGIEIDN